MMQVATTKKRFPQQVHSRAIKAVCVLLLVCISIQCLSPVGIIGSNNIGRTASLFSILTRQYDFTERGLLREFAYWRYDRAMDAIAQNKAAIHEAADAFGLPPEMIAAVILKEQFTQSAPDELVVLVAPFRGGAGSTGLGAVTADTAKKAYAYFDLGDMLPSNDQAILGLFTADNSAAIHATACVLAYEAAQKGYGQVGALQNLDLVQWHDVLYEYNGAKIYADKTVQYLPELEKLF